MSDAAPDVVIELTEAPPAYVADATEGTTTTTSPECPPAYAELFTERFHPRYILGTLCVIMAVSCVLGMFVLAGSVVGLLLQPPPPAYQCTIVNQNNFIAPGSTTPQSTLIYNVTFGPKLCWLINDEWTFQHPDETTYWVLYNRLICGIIVMLLFSYCSFGAAVCLFSRT